ncbi:MAG: alkyl sulfatase dimerization domain-containing protein [bacterium]
MVTDPFGRPGHVFEVLPEITLVSGFGLSIGIRTGDGLTVVDTSGRNHGETVVAAMRTWDESPVRNVVYTHGHFDHTGGMPWYDADAEKRGYQRPHVIAHANVVPRMDRYAMTAGYNATINARQFQSRPTATQQMTDNFSHSRRPDETYLEHHTFEQGGLTFELHHGKGETDDHTWVWIPALKAICAGDFFIWRCPNAGNPQKVQRYPSEWAMALRTMSEAGAEVFIPSHGTPIFGNDRIRLALTESAELLESLVEQTLELINRGVRLDEVIHTVEAPARLLERPYLWPLYDEPEFIVRNIWRLYAGWYDGNPANLKPSPEARVAAEIASLAGGPSNLADRAKSLMAAGELQLACHFAEMASLAAPDDISIRDLRAEVLRARAASEQSLMARGIFNAAAAESEPQD